MMNDKNWNPGTFLPDTISGKEFIKTFLRFLNILNQVRWSSLHYPVGGPGARHPTHPSTSVLMGLLH